MPSRVPNKVVHVFHLYPLLVQFCVNQLQRCLVLNQEAGSHILNASIQARAELLDCQCFSPKAESGECCFAEFVCSRALTWRRPVVILIYALWQSWHVALYTRDDCWQMSGAGHVFLLGLSVLICDCGPAASCSSVKPRRFTK